MAFQSLQASSSDHIHIIFGQHLFFYQYCSAFVILQILNHLFDLLEFVNLTSYDSACDFCLTHNGYGRVNALLYENELSRRACV